MARLGYIQIVRVCNQKCRFCSNPENGRELSLEQAKAHLDAFKAGGHDGVILTGGEPTLHDGLPELIAYAREVGLPARIITNAQRTADRDYLLRLVEAGLTHMHVSVHSHRPALQAFLTGNRDSLANLIRTLHHLKKLPVTVDLNQTICAQNADHIDESIRWFCERFEKIRHVSWNYLDPYQNRVAEHPDVIPRLADSEASLLRAMRYLDGGGRTFRIEKLPLCYMGEFAHCSTETRKLVKHEDLSLQFLDERGEVHVQIWYYGKALRCKTCRLEPICAGIWDIGGAYDPDEVRPRNDDPEPIIRKILNED